MRQSLRVRYCQSSREGKLLPDEDMLGNDSVGTTGVGFAFGTRNLTRGCVDIQRLMLPCVGLVVEGSIHSL